MPKLDGYEELSRDLQAIIKRLKEMDVDLRKNPHQFTAIFGIGRAQQDLAAWLIAFFKALEG